MFTVKDVYILGAALVGDKENDDKDEKDFAPVHMTILLQEALDAENSIRAFDGEPELESAPVLGIDDTVPYHDSLVRGAFPYGLAWQYHQDAGNNQLAAMYRNMFIDAVERSYKFNMRKH
jgi:hypothetical protein